MLAFAYCFDWRHYLLSNPDLQRAGLTSADHAVAHWLRFGRHERRSYGMQGIEIGGSAHNQFYLDTYNVDYSPSMDTMYKKEEVRYCGSKLHVDVAALGERLPFKDKSVDFIISSHVIEHFFDPIAALFEWARVARRYLFMIVPHHERTAEKSSPVTTLQELVDRHEGKVRYERIEGKHYSIWDTKSFLDLCGHIGLTVVDYQDRDDKVGNGFSVVIRVG